MEDLRLFRHLLVLLGTVALICLMIGYFSQGWLEYALRIKHDDETVDVQISRGLWSTSGCVVLNLTTLTHEACGTITEDKMEAFIESSDLEEAAKVATSDLFDNFTKLRILLMFGGVHGVVGILFSLFIHKGRNILVKSRGFCCVYSWSASAALVMTALVLHASQAYSYNSIIESLDVTSEVKERLRLKATISRIMYISGIGSLLGVFMALVLLVKLCCCTADWHKHKPFLARSDTQQTLDGHLSDDDDDDYDGTDDDGQINHGLDDVGEGTTRRDAEKNHEDPDLKIKYLMDIYM